MFNYIYEGRALLYRLLKLSGRKNFYLKIKIKIYKKKLDRVGNWTFLFPVQTLVKKKKSSGTFQVICPSRLVLSALVSLYPSLKTIHENCFFRQVLR